MQPIRGASRGVIAMFAKLGLPRIAAAAGLAAALLFPLSGAAVAADHLHFAGGDGSGSARHYSIPGFSSSLGSNQVLNQVFPRFSTCDFTDFH